MTAGNTSAVLGMNTVELEQNEKMQLAWLYLCPGKSVGYVTQCDAGL